MIKIVKIICKIIVRLIPVLALIISFIALLGTKESNKIARQALKKSEEFFISEHRPYLILEPKKKDADSYFRVSHDEKSVSIEVKYKIENVGDKPAKNISLPKIVCLRLKTNKKIPVYITLPPELALGPGQFYNIGGKFAMGMEDGIQETVDKYNSGEFGVTLQLVVFYTSELDPSKKYRTLVAHKINKDRVIILKTEID